MKRPRYTDLGAWRQRLRYPRLARPCGQQVVVPIAPYNPRNTDDPLDIEHRVENRITEYSEDVQLNESILEETYNHRTGAERTNDVVKDCGLGRRHARGRVHARTEVFVALCLRLVVAITNYERGNDPDCEML
ncbi:transposase [Halogranum amylolyticum]|uniref:transposase n=1 Tax=Halogranum amylolyticum TaxID=660520 RepID=UPI000B7DCEF7